LGEQVNKDINKDLLNIDAEDEEMIDTSSKQKEVKEPVKAKDIHMQGNDDQEVIKGTHSHTLITTYLKVTCHNTHLRKYTYMFY
jgi:hypothetical protein